MSMRLSDIHKYLFDLLIFSLPWQTIWIIKEFFYNGEKWHYGTIGIYLSDVLLLIWLISGYYLYKDRLTILFVTHKKVIITAIAFCIWLFLSITWSPNKLVALYFALKISLLVDFCILLWITRPSMRRFAIMFTVSMVIHSTLAIYQFIGQNTFSSTLLGIHAHNIWHGSTATITSDVGRWLRAYGGFAHPNIMGGFSAVALTLSVWLYLTTQKTIERYFFLISTSIIFIALIFTFSRSAWLAFVLIPPLLFLQNFANPFTKNKIMRPAILVIVFSATLFSLGLFYYDILRTRSHDTNRLHNSYSDRKEYVLHAKEMIAQHFFLGAGVGNYTNSLAQIKNYHKPIWYYQPVHNSYILIFAEIGIIGIFFMGLFCCSMLLPNLQKPLSEHQKIIGLCMLILIIISFFDHWTWTSHAGLMLSFLLLGLFAQKDLPDTKNSTQ